jgi:hypothetical protein
MPTRRTRSSSPKEQEMTQTQTIVNNMINKYVEVYARAIEAGYSTKDAHEVVAKFFADGFKAVA